jgi:hypothetical protein
MPDFNQFEPPLRTYCDEESKIYTSKNPIQENKSKPEK